MEDDNQTIVYDETQNAWRNRFVATIMICESIILTAILGSFAISSTGHGRIVLISVWFVCVVLVPALILCLRLRIRIVGRTLRVWFALLPGWRIDLSTVTHAVHMRLSPLGDLGGWGYKWTRKHGHAMNIHGEQFVIITLDNGKRRTIGTQRPEELLTAIRVVAQLPADESEIDLVENA